MAIIRNKKTTKKKEMQKLQFNPVSSPKRNISRGLTPDSSLLLLGELFGTDPSTTELDVKHTLHGTEDLLVGRGGTALEVLDDSHGGVALGGEFLLGHLVALLGTALLDSVSDEVADSLGLDDVVAAVDLGQVLAFGGARLSGLEESFG